MVAEAFFSSLKKGRIKKHIYNNRELATADISDCIDSFYNRTRRHSYLSSVSPDEFEVTIGVAEGIPAKSRELQIALLVRSCDVAA